MIPAREALQLLRDGNQRFVLEATNQDTSSTQTRRRQLASGQEPFAIILGCSDSRVPAEIVFDQGLGDLFVIRVAGNIVAPSQVGSVEFAASRFQTRLVVVLGHTQCGAILATVEDLLRPSEQQSRNVSSIVGSNPSVGRTLARHVHRTRYRFAGASRRSRQHPHVSQSAAPRLAAARATDSKRRTAGGWRRVLAGDRHGRILRRYARTLNPNGTAPPSCPRFR